MNKIAWCLFACASLAQAAERLDEPTALRFAGIPLPKIVALVLESHGATATNLDALPGSITVTLERRGVTAREVLADVLRCAGFGFTEEGATITFVPLAASENPPCHDMTMAAALAPNTAAEPIADRTELAARFEAASRDATAAAAPEAAILAQIAAQTGLALTSVGVECRTEICRLQATGPNLSNPATLLEHLTGYRRVMGFSKIGAGGVPALDVFLER